MSDSGQQISEDVHCLAGFAASGPAEQHQAERPLDLAHMALTVSQKCHLKTQRWTSAQVNFRPNTVLRQLEVVVFFFLNLSSLAANSHFRAKTVAQRS